MNKHNQTLASIVKSCTLNLLFIIASIFLIYLFSDFILDVYYKIENLISVTLIYIKSLISTILLPIFSFIDIIISKNIVIIFPIWLSIFSLLCCILFKLEKNDIQTPKFLEIITIFNLIIGLVVLLYTTIALSNEYKLLAIICAIIFVSFCLVTFLMLLVNLCCFFTNKKESDEKQLDLFKK